LSFWTSNCKHFSVSELVIKEGNVLNSTFFSSDLRLQFLQMPGRRKGCVRMQQRHHRSTSTPSTNAALPSSSHQDDLQATVAFSAETF
jgi:hypothetical protein